jgi:protein-tyrosine phosphatase
MASSFECVNFRDFAQGFTGILKAGLLYRGGSVAYCSWEQAGRPATVVNLRFEDDEPRWSGVKYLHFPIANSIEKYETSIPEVRAWLASVIKALSVEPTPILIHCRSGRDRTGVVVAVLLRLLLGRDQDNSIVDDYLRVDGARQEYILKSLQGLERKGGGSWIHTYFRDKRFPVQQLKDKFCT